MQRPQLSIAGLMFLVGITAVECVAFRSRVWVQPLPRILLVLGGLPMANTLTLGLLLVVRGRIRGETPRPFLVGFVFVGFLALVLLLVFPIWFPILTLEYLEWGLIPCLRALHIAGYGLPPGSLADLLLYAAFLTVHPLILAILGGWASRRYRFAIGRALAFPATIRTALSDVRYDGPDPRRAD